MTIHKKERAAQQLDTIDSILTEMVESTTMILTSDLPSLLQQEEVYKYRRVHKDQILKNLPEAKAKLQQHIQAEKRQLLAKIEAEAETFEKWVGGGQSSGHATTVKAVPLAVIKGIEDSI